MYLCTKYSGLSDYMAIFAGDTSRMGYQSSSQERAINDYPEELIEKQKEAILRIVNQ